MMTLIILIMIKISLSTMNAYSDGNSHLCSGHSQHSVAGGELRRGVPSGWAELRPAAAPSPVTSQASFLHTCDRPTA